MVLCAGRLMELIISTAMVWLVVNVLSRSRSLDGRPQSECVYWKFQIMLNFLYRLQTVEGACQCRVCELHCNEIADCRVEVSEIRRRSSSCISRLIAISYPRKRDGRQGL